MDGKCEVVFKNYHEDFMSEVNDKVIKEAEGTLLVGDGKPLWLLKIFSSLAGSTASKEQGLLALLYIIMYESGFYFMDGPHNGTVGYDVRLMRCLNDPNILQKHMKLEDSKYVAVFSHNLIYPNSFKVVAYTFMTNCYFYGLFLVVNFLLPDGSLIKTFLFPVDKYISINSNKELHIVGMEVELSLNLKNFLYSLKSSLTEEVYHPHHILSLPLHILQIICRYLNGKSFVKFIRTCRFLYETFSEDETLWKYHSLNDFKCLNKVPLDTWKAHYKYQIRNMTSILRVKYPFFPDPYNMLL